MEEILNGRYEFKNDKLYKNNIYIKDYGLFLGEFIWFKDNKIHRDNDKPAIEYNDGSKYWYQNDMLHRDNDKPAI